MCETGALTDGTLNVSCYGHDFELGYDCSTVRYWLRCHRRCDRVEIVVLYLTMGSW